MSILTVRHVTAYRYRQPVAFGEHRMMLRPREGHDQRLLDTSLVITPAPERIRWAHDVFGNSVAVARFRGRSTELRFESVSRLDRSSSIALEFDVEDYAATYPFTYSMEEMPDLARSIERQYPDPDRMVDRWAARFVSNKGRTDTVDMLVAMTYAIKEQLTYIPRHERGIQSARETLLLGSGTCRDFAALMMEAARSLGLAARFVSGYIYSPRVGRAAYSGGGSTHAWARIYLPGAGWLEFDPTNGLIGNRELIGVAVTRDPRQAMPLYGTYTGFPADNLGMTVEVSVTESDPAEDQAAAQTATGLAGAC